MDIVHDTSGGMAVMRLSGRLDTSTSAGVEKTILEQLAAPGSRALLDMRNVVYVSSAGLRVVLVAAKRAKTVQGGLALFGLQPSVQEVFDLSGFSRILTIAPDELAARGAIAG